MENNELYHFGILGMKWGVRRYQNEDGSRTELGKEHYGYKTYGNSESKKAPSKRDQKRVRKQLENARKAKESKKAYEEGKQKALKTGSATELLKYKNDLTLEEKREAYNRLKADEDLMSVASREAARKAENSKWNKAKKAMNIASNTVVTAANAIDNLTKLYNNSARVMNAFSDTQWPIIGEKPKEVTYSMKVAKQNLAKVKDMSMKELDDINSRLEKIQKLEKISRGEQSGGGGKKKK